MKKLCLPSARQSGFTLVELMIAITISIILLNGVLQIFQSTKQSYRTADGLSRMQETARYALDVLAQDIRSAGFLPCRKTTNIANTLNTSSGSFDFFGAPLFGFEGGVSTFPAEFQVEGTTHGTRLAGSDGLRIISGGNEVYSIVSHNPTSAQFKLSGSHDIEDGDILLVCDATNASIFQTTNANQANVTIVHNTGTASPGNCVQGLGFPVPAGCDGTYSGSPLGTAYTYGEGSQVVSFSSVIYYIGPSLSNGTTGRVAPDTNSLFRRSLGNDGAANIAFNAPEELVEGIETMQLIYGLADDPNSAAMRYVTADNITADEWLNVVSVRVGLLLHTPEEIATANDTEEYDVVGTEIDSTGTTITYPSDRRQRYVFSETIKLRNRGLGVL